MNIIKNFIQLFINNFTRGQTPSRFRVKKIYKIFFFFFFAYFL